MRVLWAFDFDGVVCHSARELCVSAWLAGRRLWPDLTQTWPPRYGLENARHLTGLQRICTKNNPYFTVAMTRFR